MTKTELETMLNKMMVQNAALTALVTEQQQQIQKLQERPNTAEAENLTLPPRREGETAKEFDKQKERVLKGLTRLPKEPIEDMPNAEEWLEMHPMVQLPMLSEGVFLVPEERHVEEVDCFLKCLQAAAENKALVVRADHPRISAAGLQSALLRLQEHTAPKEERRAPGFCA